jgi:hypothetical protein
MLRERLVRFSGATIQAEAFRGPAPVLGQDLNFIPNKNGTRLDPDPVVVHPMLVDGNLSCSFSDPAGRPVIGG